MNARSETELCPELRASLVTSYVKIMRLTGLAKTRFYVAAEDNKTFRKLVPPVHWRVRQIVGSITGVRKLIWLASHRLDMILKAEA